AALVRVGVVGEATADPPGIAALPARHRLDSPELPAELLGAELVTHPAVGEAGHPPERALDHGVGSAGSALPGQAGGVARDPDRARLLDGPGLDGHTLEAVELAGVSDVLFGEELAQDDDAFLQPTDALARTHVHHAVLERLGLGLLVGATEADGEPGSAVRELVQARPLLGEEHRVAMDERGQAA